MRPRCYLAMYGRLEGGQPMTPCSGRLIRVHLIDQQVLKRFGHNPKDPRSWVWGCGGISGLGAHHSAFDSTKTLRLARAAIPTRTEELAEVLGIVWWLDHRYGELTSPVSPAVSSGMTFPAHEGD